MLTPTHSPLRLLRIYLRPLWRQVLLLAALLLAAIAIELFSPQVLRRFIDTAQNGGPQAALTAVALLYLGVALLGQVLRVGATFASEQVGWRATNRLRADLLRHVLRLDLTFHKRNPPGALIERVDGDVTALANFFSNFVIELLGNSLLMLGTLALLYREDWRVGLGVTAYAITTLLVLLTIQRFGSGRWAAALQSEAEIGGFLDERLRGTEDIRANGAERAILGQFDQQLRDQLKVLLRAFVARALIYVGTQGLFALGYAVGLGLGAWLFLRGEASIGTAFLVTLYVGLLAQPLEGIRSQVEDFQSASAGIARTGELLATESAVVEQPRATLPAVPLAVAFDHVTFAYGDETAGDQQASDRAATLANISFTLEAGRVLGVLGRTGSGKTTLTRLQLRLYDPNDGVVRLGGVDLRDLGLADLRRRVGMVTQDVQIFAASLRDNITLFDPGYSDDAIWRVLESLGLRDVFAALPAGLDTVLGSGGAGLSAGQAQLLACARVFLRDPGLIILDEASSRLDPATEALLEQAIDRLLDGRTAIIIAHRLGTVRRADEILLLEQGRIIEHGANATLAADPNSRFAALLAVGLESLQPIEAAG